MQLKFDTKIVMFKQHVCKQCYMSTTTTASGHNIYIKKGPIVIIVVLYSGVLGNVGRATCTFSICTGYDVIIVCPYTIATANVCMRTNLAGLSVIVA